MNMTGVLNLWLDDYERQARLAPGVLTLLPVAVIAVIYGLRFSPLITSLGSFILLAGGPLLLAETVRHQGRKVQEKIWPLWGGSATTRKLRLREPNQNSVHREARRKAVSKITGVRLLPLKSEEADAVRADETIELAVSKLRDRTRDPGKFPLVNKENRSYGFQRNFYGIRWFGRLVALVTLLLILAYLAWIYRDSGWQVLDFPNVAAAASSGTFLLFWLLTPSLSRVKSAADAYADEILNAAIVISDEEASR
ncbi:hypothetical protein [Nocardiopsis sp. FR6]|uniref:hypothetical protein n=1 Tax=Nocardiopsis sp. FR6 TaxID=2605986 RepID=UPI00135C715A|nr:hypothetical protein [Nocardiopsis sp. FR6]